MSAGRKRLTIRISGAVEAMLCAALRICGRSVSLHRLPQIGRGVSHLSAGIASSSLRELAAPQAPLQATGFPSAKYGPGWQASWSVAAAYAAAGGGVLSCAGGGDQDEVVSSEKLQKRGKELITKYRRGSDLVTVDIAEIIMDPANRDGDGIKLDEVLKKGELIDNSGFDFDRVRVVLVQLPLDAAERKKIFDKNLEWKNADPRFPSWDEGRVEYTCVGGNHLVTFLKMVSQGAACSSFCSVPDGLVGARMSLECLRSSDADFALGVTRGVPAVILHRTVRAAANALQDIQAAENMGATLLTVESDKQCILRCAKMLTSFEFGELGLSNAVKLIETQFPQLEGHVNDYFFFVEQLGGLESPHFKHWRIADARFTSNRTQLRGSYLRAVGSVSVQYPRVKRGLAWCAKQLPRNHKSRTSTSVFADWFSKTDVTNLVSSGKLPEGEALLERAEALSLKTMPEKEHLRMFCRTESRVLRFLLGKTDKSFPTYESLENIMEELELELAEYKKSGKNIPRGARDKKEAFHDMNYNHNNRLIQPPLFSTALELSAATSVSLPCGKRISVNHAPPYPSFRVVFCIHQRQLFASTV